MLKAYKYRIYPNVSQEVLLNKHFGSTRFIYNWALDKKIKIYETDKKSISRFELQKEIVTLKSTKETEWLKEINSQSLQESLIHLDKAFTRFFREKKGFPKFKSKHNKQSFSCPQNIKVNFETNKVTLPKIGEIKTVFSREFKGKIKTCTISKTTTNKFFISILVDNSEELPNKVKIKEETTIGIDLGIKDFAVLSNGEKIENPKFLRREEKRLKFLQKRASKKQKGSKNRKKANLKVAKLHEKIKNRREDFLHKITTKLIRENQTICLEDLNVKGMMQNHTLAKSIAEVSWNKFNTYLNYKAKWYGKNIVYIGRFDASSKICNNCGNVNRELTLNNRHWKCKQCSVEHDRDINASINIKKFGLQGQNLIKQVPQDMRDIKLQEKYACKGISVNEESTPLSRL